MVSAAPPIWWMGLAGTVGTVMVSAAKEPSPCMRFTLVVREKVVSARPTA